ncbi:hypothetical protein Tco_0794880, partial [Tanacetum coccineum]
KGKGLQFCYGVTFTSMLRRNDDWDKLSFLDGAGDSAHPTEKHLKEVKRIFRYLGEPLIWVSGIQRILEVQSGWVSAKIRITQNKEDLHKELRRSGGKSENRQNMILNVLRGGVVVLAVGVPHTC